MLKCKILSVGKTKETWLEDALAEYAKRLKPYMTVETLWAKSDDQLVEWVEKEDLVIGLDPKGRRFISDCWEKGGSRLTFVIGGPEGLPPHIKKGYPLISLSLLTFTHQMTRLILMEQLYRAMEILKGSRYHK